MKQPTARLVTLLLTIVLSIAGSAYAQSSPVIKVNIPFEFTLGNQTFQPGSYSLIQPLQHLLVLRNQRGQTIASTFANGLELSSAPATSKLKFRSVGGRYALTEVWQQNDSVALQLQPGPSGSRDYLARHGSSEARQAAEGSQP